MEHIINDIADLASISRNDTYEIEFIVPYFIDDTDDEDATLVLSTRKILLSKKFFLERYTNKEIGTTIFESILDKRLTDLSQLLPHHNISKEGGFISHNFYNHSNTLETIQTKILSVTLH